MSVLPCFPVVCKEDSVTEPTSYLHYSDCHLELQAIVLCSPVDTVDTNSLSSSLPAAAAATTVATTVATAVVCFQSVCTRTCTNLAVWAGLAAWQQQLTAASMNNTEWPQQLLKVSENAVNCTFCLTAHV